MDPDQSFVLVLPQPCHRLIYSFINLVIDYLLFFKRNVEETAFQ